jgi:hypothetical protein
LRVASGVDPDVRIAIFWVLMAVSCSSSPSPEAPVDGPRQEAGGQQAPPEDLAALCADLSSPELGTRVDATRDLLARINRAVSGGTEQQMDAAAEFCEQETGTRPTLGSGDVPSEEDEQASCFESCVARRMGNGESREDSEGQCMQDCNEGE